MGAGSVTLGEIIGWIRDGGVIAVLIIVVWGALNEWWVTGKQYRRAIEERDDYKRELFDVLGLTDRATRALDKATAQVLQGGLLGDAGDITGIRSDMEREVRRARSRRNPDRTD